MEFGLFLTSMRLVTAAVDNCKCVIDCCECYCWIHIWHTHYCTVSCAILRCPYLQQFSQGSLSCTEEVASPQITLDTSTWQLEYQDNPRKNSRCGELVHSVICRAWTTSRSVGKYEPCATCATVPQYYHLARCLGNSSVAHSSPVELPLAVVYMLDYIAFRVLVSQSNIGRGYTLWHLMCWSTTTGGLGRHLMCWCTTTGSLGCHMFHLFRCCDDVSSCPVQEIDEDNKLIWLGRKS